MPPRPAKTLPESAATATIGIAASAGGLEALRDLFGALTPDPSIAYIVAQHLSPTHRSMLIELLARSTKLIVESISKPVRPAGGHVYVTPPNSDVELRDGLITVRQPSRAVAGPHPSADLLFSSLALEQGERAVAIVLSGTGSDGSRGVRAIKAAGGVVFAQSADSAKYDGMPRAALDTGCVDRVLAPREMAERLNAVHNGDVAQLLVGDGIEPGDLSAYEEILALVRAATQVDFSLYRATNVQRRLARRLAALSLRDYSAYLEHLRGSPAEAATLAQEMLIGVTEFFRDNDQFERLDRALGAQLARRLPDTDFRVWTPGCSTGEEAYSIAMLLLRHREQRPELARMRISIFATDLDMTAVAAARRGIFTAEAAARIPPDLMSRYLELKAGEYVMRQEVRDCIVFSQHNIVADPPFSRLDLISCRNLFIYFSSELQTRLLEMFHYALRPNGLLFLGKAEAVGEGCDLFEPLAGDVKIFARQGAQTPRRRWVGGIPPSGRLAELPRPVRRREKLPRQDRTAEMLAEAFAPPAVVIDENHRVVHMGQRLEPYLRLPNGTMALELFDFFEEDLRGEVRAQLLRCARERTIVMGRPHTASHEGDTWRYRIGVREATDRATGERHFIVSFHPLLEATEAVEAPPADLDRERDRDVAALNDEMVTLREHIATLTQELEHSNEELQALNEELQSANEELQSMNEELETSNEELQSTNEELTTVNDELTAKTAALAEVNASLESILECSGNPMLVLNADQVVHRASRGLLTLLGLDDSIVERPLRHLLKMQRVPALQKLVNAAFDTLQPQSAEIRLQRRRHRVSVHPWRTGGEAVAGVVVSFHDTTDLHEASERIARSERDLRDLTELQAATLNALPAQLCVLDGESRIVLTNASWNRFADQNGADQADFGVGSRYFDVCARAIETGECEVAGFIEEIWKLFDGTADQINFEYPCHSPTEQRWFRCDGAAIKSSERWRAVIMHTDVTARVVAEQHLRRSMTEAESASRAKSSFLANMSHELRTPLNAIIGFAQILAAETMGRIGNDKYREYAGDIVKAGEHLIGIISHILDLAMVEAGKLTLHVRDIAAHLLVEDAVTLVLHRAEAGGLAIRRVPSEDGIVLRVDDGLMRQVLVNLLINSIKFTPPGGTISVGTRLSEEGRPILFVADTGMGIRPEELDRVFEPFHQVTSPMVKRHDGVGLGLPLVRAITHLHGAEVRMRSTLGQGTTVEILFPAVS